MCLYWNKLFSLYLKYNSLLVLFSGYCLRITKRTVSFVILTPFLDNETNLVIWMFCGIYQFWSSLVISLSRWQNQKCVLIQSVPVHRMSPFTWQMLMLKLKILFSVPKVEGKAADFFLFWYFTQQCSSFQLLFVV